MLKALALILGGFFIAELVGNSPIASTILVVSFLIALPVIVYKVMKAVIK